MAEVNNISVHILDKIYQIKCPMDMVQEVQDAALYVDQEMRKVRDSGRVIGLDRIAIITALNIAHEFLSLGQNENKCVEDMFNRIKEMQVKVEEVLTHQEEMDL